MNKNDPLHKTFIFVSKYTFLVRVDINHLTEFTSKYIQNKPYFIYNVYDKFQSAKIITIPKPKCILYIIIYTMTSTLFTCD